MSCRGCSRVSAETDSLLTCGSWRLSFLRVSSMDVHGGCGTTLLRLGPADEGTSVWEAPADVTSPS